MPNDSHRGENKPIYTVMSSIFAPVTYSEKGSGRTAVGNCSQRIKSLLGHYVYQWCVKIINNVH